METKKRSGIVLAGLAVTALTWAGATATATAGPTSATPEKHCTINVDTGRTACFDSEAAALGSTHAVQTKSATRARSQADDGANIVLGRFYTEKDFSGSSFTVYGTQLCDQGQDVVGYMTFPDDMSFSSVEPYAGCGVYVFTEPDAQGDKDGMWTSSRADIGRLAGHVRSATFH